MIHIGKCIATALREERHTVQWLADELYCDRSNVYRLFRRSSVDAAMMMRLSRLLNRDFFALYSEALRRGEDMMPDPVTETPADPLTAEP